MMKDYFENPTQGRLNLNQTVSEVAKFIKGEPERFYRLIIGSDSCETRSNGTKGLNLVSAVVIHRQGKGGRYFYQKQKQKDPHSLRGKIYAETLFSLEVAEKILPLLNKRLNGKKNYELEIHIDVGRTGETREMIKEVVGMVTGNGFKAKTKPESYGASKVADKYT